MHKKRMTTTTMLLITGSVLLGVAGQLLMKHGIALHTGGAAINPAGLLATLIQPHVFAGFVCYGFASLSWLIVLSRAPLGVAYPMLSLGYAGVAVASWRLFGEPLTAAKISGIALIITGVIFLTRS